MKKPVRMIRPMFLLLMLAPLTIPGNPVLAQEATGETGATGRAELPPPVNFTDEQAHAYMMKLLGIEALRPGPSGNPKDADHANYEGESLSEFAGCADAE